MIEDRAKGALVGAAAGDALGAGYEFGCARLVGAPEMIGGGLGNFEPGEWTDDTAQTVAVARIAATRSDLRTSEALDEIAAGFLEWFDDGPPDVGIQTRRVLSAVRSNRTGAAMTAAAAAHFAETGKAAGNGSLMRTAPVALAYLDDAQALVEASMSVSALTHGDPIAGEACAVWCLAIRHAILTGEFGDLRDGLELLPDRHDFWRDVIDQAEYEDPTMFTPNGYVVTALQAAWSSITHTPVPPDAPSRHFVDSLTTAISIGDDTDTVATIAGALLGARWGASAVPEEWQRMLHGWPVGTDASDLKRWATAIVE